VMRRACTLGIALLMLAGCGGAAMQNLPASTAMAGGSQVAPELSRGDLIYVSSFYGSIIDAISYPRGKLVGTVRGSDPEGLCASTTIRGNWWVVNAGAEQIAEYAHGGSSPIATLSTSAGEPAGCSVDPTSGNLAASILGAGAVVIFKKGSGAGTEIEDGLESTFFVGYDDKGDLFADGSNSSGVGLVELGKGAGAFKTIRLPASLATGFPGGIQWDGAYLASVNGEREATIYRLAIKRHEAIVKGTVHLAGESGAFWIAGSYVVAVDGQNAIGVWKYPAGGNPIKIINVSSFDEPLGLTVSLKPR
jgi:hypothetical protein